MTNTKSLQDKHRGKYIFFLLLHLRCHGQLYFLKLFFFKLKRQSPFVRNKKFLVSFNILKKTNSYRLHKVISLLKQKRINLLIWEACKWNWLMPYWTDLSIFKFPKIFRYIIVNRTYTCGATTCWPEGADLPYNFCYRMFITETRAYVPS